MLFGKRERLIRRILVVEDEPLVAFDNEHMLNASGYEVVATVDTVADALKIIGEEALDLVLSDIRLNGDGTGIDVARAARERGLPVLFVTGNWDEVARSLGIGCLAKPYSSADLKATLAVVDARLQGRKARRLPAGLEMFEEV